jgi:uncharacterized NAD-dependent epimerase/dehydratase family protein
MGVLDSGFCGQDAGEILDGKPAGIPVLATLEDGLKSAADRGHPLTHWVMGLAPDGGRMCSRDRLAVIKAVKAGLNVDSGLHDFLTDDPEISRYAEERGVRLRDIRKPPPRDRLHFFSGKIEDVDCLKIALLGTDSAVGKRTTAWLLVHALKRAGFRAEFVGTGQTAWMQGARYNLILDSLINDFLAGEIEHAVWSAWKENDPHVVVIEGQGSLMNPAYPGGYEILAAARPDAVIMQHAPARKDYDGFPGYPVHPIAKQIQAVEIISEKPVIAVTINHEKIPRHRIHGVCGLLEQEIQRPVIDPLIHGADSLVQIIQPRIHNKGISDGTMKKAAFE